MHWKSVCVVHVASYFGSFLLPFSVFCPMSTMHAHIQTSLTHTYLTLTHIRLKLVLECLLKIILHAKNKYHTSKHYKVSDRHIQWPCHLSCKGRSGPWSTFIVGDFVNPCSPLPENTSLTKNIITSSSYAALKRKMRWQSTTRWSIWIKGVNAVVVTAPSGGDSLN